MYIYKCVYTSNLPKVVVPVCQLFVAACVLMDSPFGSEKNRFQLARSRYLNHNHDNHNTVNNYNVIHPKMANFSGPTFEANILAAE